MLRGILFDLDNTLINRDAALRDMLTQWGLERRDVAMVMEWDAAGWGSRSRLCERIADRWPHLGSAAELNDRFSVELPAFVQPDSDIDDLLTALSPFYKLGVVSNGGSKTQREKLQRAGLALPVCKISGDVGAEKPSQEIFDRALHAIDLPANEVLFVGDHPINDVEGAIRAGMLACWVAQGRSFPRGLRQPTLVVDRVTELSSVLLC